MDVYCILHTSYILLFTRRSLHFPCEYIVSLCTCSIWLFLYSI